MLDVLYKAEAALHRLSNEFGLSPGARAALAVNVNPIDDEAEREFSIRKVF